MPLEPAPNWMIATYAEERRSHAGTRMPIEKIPPGPGQESVWDYPRPPRLEPFDGRLKVVHESIALADTVAGYRVLETSHPPTYYLPPTGIVMDHFERCAGNSFCEWKGQAVYYALKTRGGTVPQVAWAYPNPTPAFSKIRDYLSIYSPRSTPAT